MKAYFTLWVAAFLPLLFVARPVPSRDIVGGGAYAYPGDLNLSRSGYATAYPRYDDLSRDYSIADSERLPVDVAGREYANYREEPFQAPRSDYFRRWGLAGGDPFYRPPAGETGYGWDPDARDIRGYGYHGQGAPAGRPVPMAARGYSFPGDGLAGPPVRGATPWQSGYRYRPLTPQEQERMNAGTGWRPSVEGPAGERFDRSEPLPPDEAYGYQTDRAFRHYYGAWR